MNRTPADRKRAAPGASLAGRRMCLRPVAASDHGWLYGLSTCEENGFRWRYGGATPSPEGFLHSLWDRVLAQFIAEQRTTGRRIGLVVAYAPDLHNGHVQVAALLEPAVRGRAWPHEAMILFADYLFTNWNLRKLYAESLDFNYQQFSSGAGRLFQTEATLREHQFWNGRYWDKHILSLSRAAWTSHRERLVRWAMRGTRRHESSPGSNQSTHGGPYEDIQTQHS